MSVVVTSVGPPLGSDALQPISPLPRRECELPMFVSTHAMRVVRRTRGAHVAVATVVPACARSTATGQLLVHGFFGFLLGTACALLAWDRWCAWREGARRWTAALGFALAAAWCHRSAPLLLAVLVTLSEGLRQRGPSGPRGWWALGLGVLVVCAAMPVWQALQRAPLEPARTVDPWAAMRGLHPLVLLDAEAERPLLLAIATLLLALWAIALRSGMACPTGPT